MTTPQSPKSRLEQFLFSLGILFMVVGFAILIMAETLEHIFIAGVLLGISITCMGAATVLS